MTYLSTDHQKKVLAIAADLERAQKRAAKLTAQLFPVGALVLIESSGRRFRIRVDHYGSYWYDPMTVYGVNVKTGSRRRFYAGGNCDRVLLVDVPKRALVKRTAKKAVKK